MKKIEAVSLVAIIVILSVLLVSLASFSVLAAELSVDKSYECLGDKVDNKCRDLSVEELAFTVLATGKCSSELRDKSKDEDEECWPDSGCRLRDTALAVLALDGVGKSTEDAEDWLLEQKKIPTDLTWYLEIDTEGETECEISYENTEKTIIINEDKKINKGAGSCLSLAQDDYWLEIDDGCYNVNFTISCDKDFKTALLYKKKNSQIIYVSGKTNSAAAEGTTKEYVNAFCFSQGSCNYEGSLWATFALSKTNHDISEFLPYLMTMAEDNEKFFPSTFLYIITNYDDYFTEIIGEQKNDYWKISDSPYHQFYDTSLALMALYGLDAEQADSVKTYLLEVQEENGCWHNDIRDTAFILYAAWPRGISINGGDTDYCEDYGYYCISSLDCSQDDVLDNQVCYGGKVCCKTPAAEKSCSEKGGITCESNQQCTGATVPASDTTKCCQGSCITETEETECEEQNYICRYACADDEIEKIYDCSGGEVCCAPSTKKSYLWVWILIILIILVVLAIIFRNQVRIWIFRIKNKFRKGPAPSATRRGPGFPPVPPSLAPGARPRMILPRARQPARIARPAARPGIIKRAITKTDKELEETFKKLKEMSK